MSRDEIRNKVENIMKDIFGCIDINLNDSMSPENIEGWDSLTHMQLIMRMEQDFKIKFTTAEIRDTKDVGYLLDIIQGRLVKDGAK